MSSMGNKDFDKNIGNRGNKKTRVKNQKGKQVYNSKTIRLKESMKPKVKNIKLNIL